MSRTLPLAALWLVGCYHPTPPSGVPCDDQHACPSGQACVAGVCGGSLAEDAAISDAAVDAVDGPSDSGESTLFVPSNMIPWSVVPANAAAFSITSGGPYLFDTDGGTLRNVNGPVDLPVGVETRLVGSIRVLAMASFALGGDQSIVVRGSRPLAIVARDTVSIAAGSILSLDAGCGAANPSCPGPGGGHGATPTDQGAAGCGNGGHGDTNKFGTAEAGGGGAGASTPGGNGGGPVSGEGRPGIACGSPDNTPLAGGSGGGVGGVDSPTTALGGRGGGGGGAVQITAGVKIAIGGIVSANGAGGESGHPTDPNNGGGGGGGGSGGGILVESEIVSIDGTLAANGGGGGGNATSANGGDGEDGPRAAACAAGGAAGLHSAGGTGGCLGQNPTSTGATTDRGGGGGAAGFITIRRTSGSVGTISPAPKIVPVR